MDRLRRLIPTLLCALIALSGVANVRAQTTPRIAYYIAADPNNVRQVYQFSVAPDSQPRQITHADSDVLAFGPAYDGLSVAYVAEKQLWLQPIHTDTAEGLAAIQSTDFMGRPVFSPDGQYVAYTDDGVWLYDLGARKSHLLVANVDLQFKSKIPNAGEVRAYSPTEFMPDSNGKLSKLAVGITLWESRTAGIVDLATNVVQELTDRNHDHVLPIYGGRALLYGNTPIEGTQGLDIAANLDNINALTQVQDFRLIATDPLYAEQAAEIAPGIVRVLGTTYSHPGMAIFYFDYTLSTGKAGAVKTVPQGQQIDESYLMQASMSPDGRLLVLQDHVTVDTPLGRIRLFDLEHGTLLTARLPDTASDFTWHPAL